MYSRSVICCGPMIGNGGDDGDDGDGCDTAILRVARSRVENFEHCKKSRTWWGKKIRGGKWLPQMGGVCTV